APVPFGYESKTSWLAGSLRLTPPPVTVRPESHVAVALSIGGLPVFARLVPAADTILTRAIAAESAAAADGTLPSDDRLMSAPLSAPSLTFDPSMASDATFAPVTAFDWILGVLTARDASFAFVTAFALSCFV